MGIFIDARVHNNDNFNLYCMGISNRDHKFSSVNHHSLLDSTEGC